MQTIHTYAPHTQPHAARGFTLIETMVAISLMSIAIVAPMALVVQSLASAYYARDQVTAYYLAQEGIEAVRGIRDNNILAIALQPSASIDLLSSIPEDQDFTIDPRFSDPDEAIDACVTTCPALQTDGTLYGYQSGWQKTIFTRTLHAEFVGATHDEIRVEVEVSWKTTSLKQRSFTISENMYRWIDDGSAE